jgi:F-type H+-transporting ATPase subunit a
MKTRTKVLIAAGVYFLVVILLGVIFGSSGKNEEFQPQNEFKLDAWVPIHLGPLDLSINKAVLYLALASAATIGTMVWISRRMQAKPNKIQMAIETAYDLTNTQETVDIFGLAVPTFAIYAATANISVPLMLTLIVWISYNLEGVRRHGFFGYLKTWLPPGLEDMNPIGKGAIFCIEAISHFVRLISLSVRLFANILAGHLLILFMGGGLAVLLGLAALGALTFPMAFAFFIFEVVLIATLQAFIFSILTAIYIGGATSASH